MVEEGGNGVTHALSTLLPQVLALLLVILRDGRHQRVKLSSRRLECQGEGGHWGMEQCARRDVTTAQMLMRCRRAGRREV